MVIERRRAVSRLGRVVVAMFVVTLALLVPVAMALLDRLQVSQVPPSLRGTPITMLCAASAALGLMGLAPVLPW